jgi:hypothetical protein
LSDCLSAQYAGSIGLYAIGIHKVSTNNKFETGILFGDLPEKFGGPVKTITVKFTYNPFRFNLSDKFQIEPLQAGVFITKHFGENLALTWGKDYPKGYYWWNRSIRYHLFVSTQALYKFNKQPLDRITVNFEANTNDLYLYSYFPNMNTLSVWEIVYFGVGVKVYWRGRLNIKTAE